VILNAWNLWNPVELSDTFGEASIRVSIHRLTVAVKTGGDLSGGFIHCDFKILHRLVRHLLFISRNFSEIIHLEGRRASVGPDVNQS